METDDDVADFQIERSRKRKLSYMKSSTAPEVVKKQLYEVTDR